MVIGQSIGQLLVRLRAGIRASDGHFEHLICFTIALSVNLFNALCNVSFKCSIR